MHKISHKLALPLLSGHATNQKILALKTILVLTQDDKVCEDLILDIRTNRLRRLFPSRMVDRDSISSYIPSNGHEILVDKETLVRP
jgi:hypothetical protein